LAQQSFCGFKPHYLESFGNVYCQKVLLEKRV